MKEYFLKTERIGFSLWGPDDTDLAQSLWGDKKVSRYICASGVYTTQEVKDRLDLEMENQKKFGFQYWPMFSLEDNTFIGCCGLRPYRLDGVYEMGLHLRPDFWCKGFGTEAANAILGYVYTELHINDLFAAHHPHNPASAKMLRALGFSHMHDEYYEPTGLMHPSYRLSMERSGK